MGQPSAYVWKGKNEGLVESQELALVVIPAKAGHAVALSSGHAQPLALSSNVQELKCSWTPVPAPDGDPGFTGATTSCDFIMFDSLVKSP